MLHLEGTGLSAPPLQLFMLLVSNSCSSSTKGTFSPKPIWKMALIGKNSVCHKVSEINKPRQVGIRQWKRAVLLRESFCGELTLSVTDGIRNIQAASAISGLDHLLAWFTSLGFSWLILHPKSKSPTQLVIVCQGFFSFLLLIFFKRHLSESINQVNCGFRLSVLFVEGDRRGLPWPPGWTAEWSCSVLTLTSVTSGTLLPLSHLFFSVALVGFTRFFISFLLSLWKGCLLVLCAL